MANQNIFMIILLLILVGILVGSLWNQKEHFSSGSDLTLKEKELFEDLSNNKLSEEDIMKLVNAGVINDKLIQKFLSHMDADTFQNTVQEKTKKAVEARVNANKPPPPKTSVVKKPTHVSAPEDEEEEDEEDPPIVRRPVNPNKPNVPSVVANAPKAPKTPATTDSEQVAKLIVEPFCGAWNAEYAAKL